MPTPDFSKIWASNSPLTPYVFSDSEYQEGWNSVGSTPPARTQFDALQKQNDEKFAWLKENGGINLLQRSKAYAVGDIAYSANLPSWAYLECTVAGTTAVIEPTMPTAEGEILEDGTAEFECKRKYNNGGGHYIGEFVAMSCTASYVPEGCVPANGTEYAATQFPTLWESYLTADTPLLPTCSYADYASEIASKGQCNKWAIDTVNETFKVPTIKDGSFLQQALSNSELGKCYNAGLPNIEGKMNFGSRLSDSYYAEYPGAAQWSESGDTIGCMDFSGFDNTRHFTFDASRSSSIYGNSDTVQPNSVTVRFFVCVASGSVNQSVMDWSAYMSALQGKADKDRAYDLYDDFTIIYPNGGTEESPANVTNNTRYVEDNPFSGYEIYCVAEIKINDSWGEAGWYTDGSHAKGAKASVFNNSIVLQTGDTQILVTSVYSGNPFGYTGEMSSAPCRVKVWKIGKQVNA